MRLLWGLVAASLLVGCDDGGKPIRGHEKPDAGEVEAGFVPDPSIRVATSSPADGAASTSIATVRENRRAAPPRPSRSRSRCRRATDRHRS